MKLAKLMTGLKTSDVPSRLYAIHSSDDVRGSRGPVPVFPEGAHFILYVEEPQDKVNTLDLRWGLDGFQVNVQHLSWERHIMTCFKFVCVKNRGTSDRRYDGYAERSTLNQHFY